MKLSTGLMGILDLIPYERNSKLHKDVDIDAIAASITRFGFNDPIGITPEGVIIEGHGRWLAAQKMGLEQVPVLIIEGLSEKDYDLYRIGHNKIAQSSTFDFGALFDVLQSLAEDAGNNIEFADMGFSNAIVDNLFSHFAPPEQRADAARAQMGVDGTAFVYDIVWDTKADKECFNQFIAAEVAKGADKSMGAEILLSTIREHFPDIWEDACRVFPGDVSLDSLAGATEMETVNVG
jgi:hypothetical protein